MTSFLFEAYVVLVLLAVLVVARRWLERRDFVVLATGALAWVAWVGLLSGLGVLRNPALRPPGALYVFLPVFGLVAYCARSGAALRVALALPVVLLIGLQTFRVGVELLLHRLSVDGLVPRLMTYDGGNVDIAIGLSAPFVAWLAGRGGAQARAALVWNVVGLAALANVAIRAVGTAPGPLRFIASAVPNVAVGLFPFSYLAGFFAPLAVLCHVLAIRSLRARPKERRPGSIVEPAEPVPP